MEGTIAGRSETVVQERAEMQRAHITCEVAADLPSPEVARQTGLDKETVSLISQGRPIEAITARIA